MSEGTIASRYLDARSALHVAECALDGALHERFADCAWEYTADPYDGSLELYLHTDEDPAAIGAFVLSLGFDRCWIHLHDGWPEEPVRPPMVNHREHYYPSAACIARETRAAAMPKPASEAVPC